VSDCAPAALFVSETHASAAQTLESRAHLVPLGEVASLADGAETLPDDHAPPALDAPLMILYTSGTTGQPKGVVLSHKMLFWNSVNTQMRLDLTTADRSFNAAPFHHTGGWNVLLTPFLHHGATTYLLPSFDAETILHLCDDAALTILWGVPTMLQRMRDHEAFRHVSLNTVRYAVVGGEAMPEPLIRDWHAKDVPIRQGFGMTEVGVNCFSLPEEDALRKIGSIGFPNFYIDMRVVDDDGRDVPPNTPGELLLRGPVVTPGYWRNPEATADAIDEAGWFYTNDLVRVDPDGYTYVVGRKTDMYISGGENVYPAEVQTVLHAHPAIAEAAVVGVPDDEWGEVGAAFIVRSADASLDADAVRAHARDHLAAYKVPKHVRFVDALPKGHSGKIQKADLADRFRGAPHDARQQA
jgi:fatty-acyl-CoA synthase